MAIAVTADIVGSRRIPDRPSAQRTLDAVIARVESEHPLATAPLRPTVGDELQGVYPTLDAALAALLLLQLALPDAVQCRFGVGAGPIRAIPSSSGDISEGPGWWAAREAIEKVHGLQQRRAPQARTWVVASSQQRTVTAVMTRSANAYLLARDQLVGSMSERTRRLTYGRCLGVTQRVLAAGEDITQSAVSQALSTSGALAVVEGFRLLGSAS